MQQNIGWQKNPAAAQHPEPRGKRGRVTRDRGFAAVRNTNTKETHNSADFKAWETSENLLRSRSARGNGTRSLENLEVQKEGWGGSVIPRFLPKYGETRRAGGERRGSCRQPLPFNLSRGAPSAPTTAAAGMSGTAALSPREGTGGGRGRTAEWGGGEAEGVRSDSGGGGDSSPAPYPARRRGAGSCRRRWWPGGAAAGNWDPRRPTSSDDLRE